MKLISYTTDFGPGNKGHGVMQAIAWNICQDARIIELATNVDGFNVGSGARAFEAVKYLPIGFHVCVVDPGVGTKRKAIIIKTRRGDYLIGPDNGVMVPAAELLGGIERLHEITNENYMNKPVSPIFHGRDVFMPVAAHLANGISIEDFGKEIKNQVAAPFENAKFKDGKIEAEIIDTNKFGGAFLNVLGKEMDNFKLGQKLFVNMIEVTYGNTFGDVPKGEPVIMKDDFERVEMAVNVGNFLEKYNLKTGDHVIIKGK
ncbi:MAG: SAM-dependent chlorinase/fluorinase [Candidatus Micrarchaeota archaeon]